MANGFWRGVGRFVMWDYARATWQYDVMVAIILGFVFLTPRGWFRDQPRIPRASAVARLPVNHGADVFWIEPELLTGIPDGERVARAAGILKSYTGKTQQVVHVETIFNSEQEITGYMAFARP